MKSSPSAHPSPGEPTAEIQHLLRYRWILYAVLGFDGALLSFHYVWGATLSKQHAVTWRLDAGQLGLLAALGFLPYALMQIPGGYLTDLFGGRWVLTIALTVTAIGTAFFALAPTYSLALIGRIVIGVGSAVILLPTLAVLARWFRVREYATIQGGYLLLSAIGSLMATVPLALAAERWSWRVPMLGVAIATLFGAGLTWWVVRNRPTDLDLPSIASIDPDAGTVEEGEERVSLRAGIHAWRTMPTLWVSSLILFASWGALQAFQGLWAGPLLRHVRGFTAAEVGQSLFMFTLGVGLGPVLFGWLSDRVVQARRPVVIASIIGQTLLWTLVVLAINRLPTLLVNLTFLGIAALSGGVLVAQVMIKELCPPGAFGTIFGIINGSGFYGTAAIQLMTGAILTAVGPEMISDEPIYGASAYALALCPIVCLMTIAACCSIRLRETLGRGRTPWPQPTS
jgi:sugar phosphate permease